MSVVRIRGGIRLEVLGAVAAEVPSLEQNHPILARRFATSGVVGLNAVKRLFAQGQELCLLYGKVGMYSSERH